MPGAALLARLEGLAAAEHLFVSGVLALRPGELSLCAPGAGAEAGLPRASGGPGGSDGAEAPQGRQTAQLAARPPAGVLSGAGRAAGAETGPRRDDPGAEAAGLPAEACSLALISPLEPGFWDHVASGPEFRDGGGDPLDRWSARVISALAAAVGGRAVFPFGGPPWHPFLGWAQRSGRVFASPVLLNVHDRMGLWASWRGAVALAVPLPQEIAADPCRDCTGQPCRTACPAGALGPGRYDLPSCHAYLDSPGGSGCMTRGCHVRRACPVSLRYGRLDVESAHHMRHFHP